MSDEVTFENMFYAIAWAEKTANISQPEEKKRVGKRVNTDSTTVAIVLCAVMSGYCDTWAERLAYCKN